MEIDSIKKDKEICQEQVVEEIILSMWQVLFFGQCQLPLPPASSF